MTVVCEDRGGWGRGLAWPGIRGLGVGPGGAMSRGMTTMTTTTGCGFLTDTAAEASVRAYARFLDAHPLRTIFRTGTMAERIAFVEHEMNACDLMGGDTAVLVALG